MPTATVNSSWAKYRPKSGARWDAPYDNTVMAGNNASGGIYRALWYFPTGSMQYNNINSISLAFYRTGTTTSQKTLNLYVASSYNSDGTANITASIGSYTFSAGAGWKYITVPSGAISSLKAYGYVYVDNATNNTYTEFSPTAQATIDYTDAVAPNPPAWLTVSPALIEPGKTTVTISWGGVSTPGGSITGYNVDYGSSGGNWGRVRSGLNATSTTDTWSSGWARGTNIGYRVQTINSYGLASGTIANWTAYINARPSTLTGLKYNGSAYTASCYTESPLVFSWDAAAIPAHGSPLARYEVQLGVWDGSGYTWGSPISTGTTRSYSWDVTDYDRGQRLWINVRYVDTLGAASNWSGLNYSAIYYNRIPTACTVAYPTSGSTVYSGRPRVCLTAGSDPDGQPITLVGMIGSTRVDSNSSAWSRSSYAGGSKATLRWPTAVTGDITVNVCANDGAADGESTGVAVHAVAPNWTDAQITAGNTPVKALHIIELRQAVSNLRSAYGLPEVSWIDAQIIAGSTPVKSVHITELRQALDDIRARINGYDSGAVNNLIPAFGWSAGVARTSPIKAAHIRELRQAVEQI